MRHRIEWLLDAIWIDCFVACVGGVAWAGFCVLLASDEQKGSAK